MSDGILDSVVLGTAGLGGAWGVVNKDQAKESILFALERGITQIDTAPAYMDAEEIVGAALKEWWGQIPIISTKIGKKRGRAEEAGLVDYHPESLKASFFRSLEKMGLDRVELLFLHEPESILFENLEKILVVVDAFRSEGLVKKIGLGGRPTEFLYPLIQEGIFEVVMDFNGYNLIERKAAYSDFPFYKKHHLELYEGSPLMMGLLGRRFDEFLKNKPVWLTEDQLRKAVELQRIADEIGYSLSTLAHRFFIGGVLIDKVVIGPCGLVELEFTLQDFNQGPLDEEILKAISVCIA